MGSARVNLLLDTHIWVWSHTQPERLTKRVTAALTDETNQLWLSPISIWEFLLLAERGRIRVKNGETAADWVEAALARAPMRDAALSREVALQSRVVRVEHEDPADRFLAATAAVYELVLVTADERLLRGKGFRTLANR
jgi:PIN domain nuclease of toxin-antitoxin system